MSLAQTQDLLARLLTDAPLRAQFDADQIAVARRFGLSEAEAQRFSTIDRRALSGFAQSLFGKRALDARKVLPLTFKALGPEFDRRLIAALDGPPSTGRHRADAARLVSSLVAHPDAMRPWLGDLARYELAFVEASRPGGALVLRLFRWPPARLADSVRRAVAPKSAPRRALGIWVRTPRGRLRHWLY